VKRVLLLSGGIDSMALAHQIRPEHALTFDYGQAAAEAEVAASGAFCRAIGLAHEVIRIDCSALGLGIMRRDRPPEEALPRGLDPPSPEWWPFRNQLLITMAAARAVALGSSELLVGAVRSDREHRDGLPEFYRRMDELLGLQEGGVRLRAPAVDADSADLVRASGIPLSLLAWSHSCHRGSLACGLCRGCSKHARVLGEVFGR
jgi:7-cyano-7-deazaguanine synthase